MTASRFAILGASLFLPLAACGPRTAPHTAEPVPPERSEPPPPLAGSTTGAGATDAGPPTKKLPPVVCGKQTCADDEICEVKCTCCGMPVPKSALSASYTCKRLPAGCDRSAFCGCAGLGYGLCSQAEGTISTPCA